MTRIHGGFANRLYRLDTNRGSFAVKELNRIDRRWTYRAEDVFRFERAAFAAQVASQVLFIDGGAIVERGSPDQVIAAPSNDRTKTFLKRILDPA